jgi:D-2-hydroxyacid dehydrogenase (NADP+)
VLPPKDHLTICFAHVVYQLQQRFLARRHDIKSFEVRDRAELDARIGDADVLVVSGLWHNGLVANATRLRFIQSIGAGVDQFPREALAERGIRLASGRGVNARAVSEHALALVLAMARRLPEASRYQAKKVWRGMLADIAQREDELGGKTLLIVGLGDIGSRLARLAKAFDMRVIGLKRNPATGADAADAVFGIDALQRALPDADYVALTCPLTKETEHLINADAFERMRPTAYLINVARGRVVAEPDLVAALRAGRIAGAGIDVTVEEPLPPSSPLWDLPNVLITPHSAGETQRYEDNVLDILEENLQRLWRADASLKNQVV